jgi:hypothetical protein
MDDTLPSKNCSGWYPGQKKMVPNGSTRTHGQVWQKPSNIYILNVLPQIIGLAPLDKPRLKRA